MPPASPAIYKQHRLESWDDFLKIITGSPYSNWAFRGHRKEAWPLASALSRYFRNFHIDRRAWPQQEGRILRVFKRKAHQFLTQPPDPDDEFQVLSATVPEPAAVPSRLTWLRDLSTLRLRSCWLQRSRQPKQLDRFGSGDQARAAA